MAQQSRMRRAGFLLALALLCWPLAEPYLIQTERVTLSMAGLAAGAAPLRIVFVADIHSGRSFPQARVDALVRRVNALEPDIILLGGDYADDSAGAVDFFLQGPAFRARYAVCAVAGNHDRTLPESNLARLTQAMTEAGVTPLTNDVLHVDTHAGTITLAGIDDIDNGWPDVQGVADRAADSGCVLFLCHSPAVIPDALALADPPWYDLGLFGHTHGGQFALLGPLLAARNMPEGSLSGWTAQQGVPHLISRGIGTTFLPVRLLCTPQIHLIELVPTADSPA